MPSLSLEGLPASFPEEGVVEKPRQREIPVGTPITDREISRVAGLIPWPGKPTEDLYPMKLVQADEVLLETYLATLSDWIDFIEAESGKAAAKEEEIEAAMKKARADHRLSLGKQKNEKWREDTALVEERAVEIAYLEARAFRLMIDRRQRSLEKRWDTVLHIQTSRRGRR